MDSAPLITHRGGCHCRRVRFQVQAPAELEVLDCNCSICRMTGFLHLIVPASRFRLLAGRDPQSATVNQKTKDGSVSRKVVQQKGIKAQDPLFTSIALDVLIDGHVSRYNANRLHSRGLAVEDLGLPSYTDYRKKHPGNGGGAGGYSKGSGRPD